MATTKGCRRKLADGQWWNFCGETDMGQTLPALCTECGGEFVLANQIAKLLSDKTGVELTDVDYETWLEGDGSGDLYKFDLAVVKFLGEDKYNQAFQLARLDAYLCYKLGVGEQVCGGINLSKVIGD